MLQSPAHVLILSHLPLTQCSYRSISQVINCITGIKWQLNCYTEHKSKIPGRVTYSMLQIVAASVPAFVRAGFTSIAAVADLAGVFGSKSSWQQSAAKHQCGHDCREELHLGKREEARR